MRPLPQWSFLFALLASLLPAVLTAAEVQVLTAENLTSLAPDGKEADAIVGDYVLRSAEIVAVVAQPTAWRNANMTTKGVGAGVIDLTFRAAPNDQLTAFYPDQRKFKYGDPKASVEAGVATLRFTAAATDKLPAAELTYRLSDGEPWLAVTTLLKNSSDREIKVSLADELRADNSFDKTPSGRAPFWWADDNYFGQAYGLVCPGFTLNTTSDARKSQIQYLAPKAEADQVTLAPQGEYAYTRHLFPAGNRVAAWVRAQQLAAGEKAATSTSPTTISVTDPQGQPVAGAWLRLSLPEDLAGKAPANWPAKVGVARTDDKGQCELPLIPGDYKLSVQAVGHGRAVDSTLSVAAPAADAAASATHVIKLPAAGRVVAEIVDGDGKPIPAKCEFFGVGLTLTPDLGHESETFGVKRLRYTPNGKFDQKLDPGTYEVVVSHGPEYNAYFGRITVTAGQATPLKPVLPRVVDTRGWISADFHSHASPSGDNTADQRGRVLNLVAEHIEFAPCTEHNRVDSYLRHYAPLGIAVRMATCSGIELTGLPLPLNHQNAFPIVLKPGEQNNGGPETEDEPVEQIGKLALWDNRSEKLIQQNHPDLGWMFFDKDADGQPDGGFKNVAQFQNVIEVHQTDTLLRMQPTLIKNGAVRNHVAFNWLQMLNQGFRVPIVHNTDAHYNFHGSGGIRNYVRSSSDDPAKINTLEIVRESKAGHIVLTNGPFLEVSAQGGLNTALPGDEIAVPGGSVLVSIRVQCPNWLDIDRVQILVNGRASEELNFTREKQSKGFGNNVVKFERRVAIDLPTDAHLVVLAVHEHRHVGPVMGPNWGGTLIAACANPIFIDVDGGGFKANGDTLGQPLPVASPANQSDAAKKKAEQKKAE